MGSLAKLYSELVGMFGLVGHWMVFTAAGAQTWNTGTCCAWSGCSCGGSGGQRGACVRLAASDGDGAGVGASGNSSGASFRGEQYLLQEDSGVVVLVLGCK